MSTAVSKQFKVSLRSAVRTSDSKQNLYQLAVFSRRNAGDHLLTIALRDLFDEVAGSSRWRLKNIRQLYQHEDIKALNRTNGVIVGGGGLFLRDTNENPNSGWQWNCPLRRISQIRIPLAVFAVGYNRFRQQPEFEPIFKEHVTLLTEKCIYLGLRNHGSINAIRSYLPEDLHHKVCYQPCPTTLLGKLYPDLIRRESEGKGKPIVSVNMAFDRPVLRYGDNELAILMQIAGIMRKLSSFADIHLIVQGSDDDHFLPFLRSGRFPFERIDLQRRTAREIVQYYASVDLVLGMRGHSQLIPFGCHTPILSLISHDKLQWFLDDIHHPEWGVEVNDPDLEQKVFAKSIEALECRQSRSAEIIKIQEALWSCSENNVRVAMHAISEYRRSASADHQAPA